MLDFRATTFLCVCKHMNYTKAANELHLTQPAISQHIKYLEQYYDTKLFLYENKKLQLTKQGAYIKRALETLQHDSLKTIENVKNIQDIQVLRIGATRSIGDYYLTPFLSNYLSKKPNLCLSLYIADTEGLLKQLDAGTLDFVLCEGYFPKTDYAHKLIKKEQIFGLCSSEYPIKKITGLEDLFSHRLLLREPGSGTREIFERYLQSHGYSVDCFPRRCSFSSPHLIMEMLRTGQGIGFLYECVANNYLENGLVRKLSIPGFQLEHEFNGIWKKDSMFHEDYLTMIEELFS